MLVYVYSYVWVAHVCKCQKATVESWVFFPPSGDVHIVFLRQGLLLGLGAYEIILTMSHRDLPVSASPALELQAQVIYVRWILRNELRFLCLHELFFTNCIISSAPSIFKAI